MKIIKFRNKEEHEDLMHKVKKMKKFTEELEDMLEECYDEDLDYRGGYRKDWDEEESSQRDGRYGYRRGGRM